MALSGEKLKSPASTALDDDDMVQDSAVPEPLPGRRRKPAPSQVSGSPPPAKVSRTHGTSDEVDSASSACCSLCLKPGGILKNGKHPPCNSTGAYLKRQAASLDGAEAKAEGVSSEKTVSVLCLWCRGMNLKCMRRRSWNHLLERAVCATKKHGLGLAEWWRTSLNIPQSSESGRLNSWPNGGVCEC